MRVCLVSYEFPPSGGGEASYVSSLANGLAKRGHEVFVVTPNGRPAEAAVDMFKVITTHRRRSILQEMDFLSQAEREISLLAEHGRIDLVHVTFDYPTFLFRMSGRGVPCVATVHHLHLVEALSMLGHEKSAAGNVWRVLRASFLTALEGRLVRQCDAVVAVSEFTARSVGRLLKIRPDAVQIVRNGIDPMEFEGGNSRRFRERFPLLRDKTILYVGRLERSKGLHHLIPAFARVVERVPEATMAVVGRGSDGYLRELSAMAKSKGVSERIAFTGRLPQDLLPDAYAASSLVVLPSLMEGFGISLLEAMASGRPCVATRVGALPEIVRAGQTGLLVDPADPAALGDAMCELLRDPTRAAEMGRRGLDAVRRNYTVEKMTEDTLEVYRAVVSQAKTRTDR